MYPDRHNFQGVFAPGVSVEARGLSLSSAAATGIRMHQRWSSLFALTPARAGMGFQFQSVVAVSPLLSESLGLDKSQLGWLIGLYLLPGIAVALPGGLLGARFGDRRLVLAGLGLMGVGGVWLSLAGSFYEATAARVASGIGAVMQNVLVTKMVADWFEGRERFLAMSILIKSWPIGIGVALLVVGPLWRGLHRDPAPLALPSKVGKRVGRGAYSPAIASRHMNTKPIAGPTASHGSTVASG